MKGAVQNCKNVFDVLNEYPLKVECSAEKLHGREKFLHLPGLFYPRQSSGPLNVITFGTANVVQHNNFQSSHFSKKIVENQQSLDNIQLLAKTF